jgi:uncharacterized protein (DUF1015 family)
MLKWLEINNKKNNFLLSLEIYINLDENNKKFQHDNIFIVRKKIIFYIYFNLINKVRVYLNTGSDIKNCQKHKIR